MYLPLYQRWINVFREEDTWKCVRCGACCQKYAVELNKEDLKRFSPSEIEILEDGRKRLKRKKSGVCIFYDPVRRLCKIYERRPDSCRTFPFSILREEVAEKVGLKFKEEDLVEHDGKRFILIVDELCTGLGKGGRVNRREIVKNCYEVAKRFGFKF